MANRDFEFMEGLQIPPDEEFEDHLRVLEEEALAIYQEEADYGEITAEECEALYAGWIKKYRGTHPRPALVLPVVEA